MTKGFEIPVVWRKFGSLFHQDFLLDYPDLFSGIPLEIESWPTDERAKLGQFLNSILEAQLPPSELTRIWFESGASYIVYDRQIRPFLTKILGLIDPA